MACEPASQQMRSLQDLAKYPASQPEVKPSSSDENSNGAQSSHKSWDKPVKLNVALMQGGLLVPHSAKKVTQRQLFASGRNVMKDIQNRAAARKTLSVLPQHAPSSVRRPSETYKASFLKPKNVVNKNRPSVGQAQHPGNRRGSKMYQRKTQVPVALGTIRSAQKISASSAKKGDTKPPVTRFQNQSSSATALPSRQSKISGKVMGRLPHLANLENSVNLLNVDDIEEKLVKESSLLKSQILKQIHKNTGVNTCDVRNEQKILDEQTEINEKLKNMDEKLKNLDEKLDKTLNELANLTGIVKNLSSNQETVCRKCSCHCQTTQATATKSNGSTAINNLEQIGVPVSSDEQSSETKNYVVDSEKKRYSLRRSSRLNNIGAQYAYESLRKSTKLLTTPRHGSAKKMNTPGRISRKVIAQLNDLYGD
ncbi:uncharacterized protein LOC126190826 [Schistocerca cancellata]|uniref:uncharacterized protein LOC126190826 n=1 Tax=Schistocerca cancellata TaxID=274614 RepID=UPI0021193B79|nr:uncharacterized protein LOC126190826 [Schistocerca cancellata]